MQINKSGIASFEKNLIEKVQTFVGKQGGETESNC